MVNGVFTVGASGQFTFEYFFDGSWFQGELGIYSLAGLESLEPGSEEYIQEAASRALSNSESGHIVLQDNAEGAKYSTPLPWEADRRATNQFTALDEFGTFGFESGTDRDFNDVVFQITGAEGEAIAYDEVRNPSRNFGLSTIAEILTQESENHASAVSLN